MGYLLFALAETSFATSAALSLSSLHQHHMKIPALLPSQQVWPASLSRVTAVEPSDAMSQLGKRLEAARRFAHPQAPLVSHGVYRGL
jgi:hypothetical protein